MLIIDQKHARSFLLVCEEGTLRAAAYRLELEPSSISRQITALENQMGLTLLERGRNGVKPTEAGALLLAFLRHQSADLEALQSDFDALRGMQRGEVTIAIGDGFISDFISNALPSFRTALPGITFRLRSGSSDDVMRDLREDAAHFGFAFNPPPDEAIRLLNKVRQPLEVLLHPEAAAASSTAPLSFRDLANLTLALPLPNFGVGSLLRVTEAKYRSRLPTVLETDSLAALRNFVREDLGATVLPAFVVAREIADGTIVTRRLDVPELSKGEATILARVGRRLPEAATRLINHAARSMLAFKRTG